MRRLHVFHPQAREIAQAITSLDPAREVIAWSDRQELARDIADVEILFAPMPPRDGWAGAVKLELIQLAGVGASHFLPCPDLPARVAIATIRGRFANEAAEHAILMMLALERDLLSSLEAQREKTWAQRPVRKLAGRTALVVGLGEIGRRIAARAKALEMRVSGVSRRARAIESVDEVFAPDRIREAIASADHIVVAVPLTERTRHLIDRAAIDATRRGAFIVHLSRGGVIDEAALLGALERGHVGGAAIDVFEEEPLPRESPWWTAPRTIVTAHLAGLGERYIDGAIEVFLENVRRVERGERALHPIDRDAGY
jgi:phosphoglycerate dehydrogenase-like enzyme